jgi:hypothetical protein
MAEVAKNHGFSVISSQAQANTTTDDILDGMVDMAKCGENLSNTIFILDTLKKFADVLSKQRLKEFFVALRHLTRKGASIIALAHANKYLDDNGNMVYEGVGDMKADIDAMYYLYDDGNVLASDVRYGTLKYEKGRAINAMKEVSYRFDLNNYEAHKLDMVIDTKRMAHQHQLTEEYSDLIEHIKDNLRGGISRNQSHLTSEITEHFGLSRYKAIDILHKLSGKVWFREKGGDTNRAYIYSLDKPKNNPW